MGLVTTFGQLKALLEIKVVNVETGQVWEGGWVWDAWLEFVPLLQDDQADLSGFSMWLERHGLPYKKANYVAQVIGDSLHGGAYRANTVFDESSDDWEKLIMACEFASKTRFKSLIAPIVVGRNTDGSLRWKLTKLKDDFDGTITGDDKGEPIWLFDPETLELDHIPTAREVKFRKGAAVEWKVCARLSDIEGGKI